MKRICFFIVLFSTIHSSSSAQENRRVRHIYGLISDFYYLDIQDAENYKLKVGMYSGVYSKGQYEISEDTLSLVRDAFPDAVGEAFNERKDQKIKAFSQFSLHDSLLLPLRYRTALPISCTLQDMGKAIKEYVQNDGHAYYRITLYSDSTYMYSTGTDIDRHKSKGKWTIKDNLLILSPTNPYNLLYWISVNHCFVMIDNFIVGETYDKKGEIKEYNYLIELKARECLIRTK